MANVPKNKQQRYNSFEETGVNKNTEEQVIIPRDAPLAIYELDLLSLKFKWVNEYVCRLLGYSEKELLSQKIPDLLCENSKEVFKINITKALNLKKTYFSTEVQVKTKNGSSLWGLFNSKVIFVEGKPSSVLVFAYDITQSKKAEEAISQSERRLKNILNAMDDGIVLLGLDGRIIDCNQATLRQYNLKREEIIGKEATDFIISINRKNIIEETRASLQKTGKAIVETQIFRRDYSPFFAEISLSRFYDENNSPMGLIGVARDITERKKIEEDLAKSKQRLTDILSSIDEYVFSMDKNWNIIYVSNKAAAVAGYKPQDLIGKCFWTFGSVFCGTAVEMNFREAMDKREIKHFEWKSQLVLGFIQFTVFPSNEGITIYGQDISEFKKLQKELENYTRDLEKLVEKRTEELQKKERLAAIGATAGMVGHDIRNPLQAITGDVYLAKIEARQHTTKPRENQSA